MALPLAVIGGAAQALGGIAQGLIGGRARRREQREAQNEFNRMKNRYSALDTSNPYANVTNTFESLSKEMLGYASFILPVILQLVNN